MKAIKKFIATIDEGSIVVFESTGCYHGLLHKLCDEKGVACCLVNPSYVKHFRNAMGKKIKTDMHDAMIIACYAKHMELRITPYNPEYQQELNKLVDWRGNVRANETKIPVSVGV